MYPLPIEQSDSEKRYAFLFEQSDSFGTVRVERRQKAKIPYAVVLMFIHLNTLPPRFRKTDNVHVSITTFRALKDSPCTGGASVVGHDT